MSEAAASLCPCSSRASRAASRPGACAAPPRAARQRSSAGALAAIAVDAGATALAGLLALVMAALVLDARRWVRLAARSRVGARSEDSGSTSAQRAGGGGVAAAALAPVWRARGYRQRRDRPDRGRVRDRDQDAHVRRTPPGPRPADGRVAVTGIGGAGAVEGRSRCCAWCAPAGLSTSRTRFSWCRLTAWRRRSEPAREPHPAPGSWPRSPRPAEREALRGLLAAQVESGRRRRRTRR